MEEEGDVVVRKAGRYTSEDIHHAIFPQRTPASKKLEDFDKGVRRYMKKKHARVGTNVLVRLVTRDDRKQVAAAESFVSKGAWVSTLVLTEATWILTAVYYLSHAESRRPSTCFCIIGILSFFCMIGAISQDRERRQLLSA
jgi:hypothetical protein